MKKQVKKRQDWAQYSKIEVYHQSEHTWYMGIVEKVYDNGSLCVWFGPTGHPELPRNHEYLREVDTLYQRFMVCYLFVYF